LVATVRDVPGRRLRPAALACLVLAAITLAGPASAQIIHKWFGTWKIVVVLVDQSISIPSEDRQLYAATFKRLLAVLGADDRVVLAPISDRTLTAFVPVADAVLPGSGGSLKDKEALAAARSELLATFGRMLEGSRSKKTHILDALNLCQQLFEADRQHKERWVVMLSDMLEDSESLDFERITLTPDVVQRIIQRRKAAGTFPRLDGVRVWVAGARARDAAKMFEVKAFWGQYLKEAGAVMPDGAYVRDGLRFDVK
jgi:hypothetical protein